MERHAAQDRPTCVGLMDQALALEQSGRDVIHLEKGEPDLATPHSIQQSVIRAVLDGKTHYTSSSGLPRLREAICAHYERTYGVLIDPSQVIVNAGSSPGLLTAFLTLLTGADEVVVPDPGYPSYRRLIEVTGATAVPARTARNGFTYTATAAATAITPATKAVVVNFPSNPLGTTIGRQELAEFATLGPLVISDEVYHGLSYGAGRDHSILEFTDQAIVVNSFSKTFAMTGWRLGYCLLPESLAHRARRIHEDAFISPNAFVQWAGIDALADAQAIVPEWREELRRRRNVTVDGLTDLGFQIACPPMGAFYIFAKLPDVPFDSFDFTSRLLDEEHVAVTPGPEFGSDCQRYVRFAYTAPVTRIEEALERVRRFLRRSQC